MFSIPSGCSTAARLPLFPYPEPRNSSFFIPARFYRRRKQPGSITAVGTNPSDTHPLDGQPLRALFPGGFKRPEIKLPSLVLRVSAEEVLRSEEGGSELSAAVSRGVRIVVLDVGQLSGGRAYEAACKLKSVVGDRAYLLIAERVDVAAAVGANGVVLSDQGIPAIVARNMMWKSKSDAVSLPLVARSVQNELSAEHAASYEGADFVILSDRSEIHGGVLAGNFTQHINVPVFFNVELTEDNLAVDLVPSLLQSGASGIVVSLDDLKLFSDDINGIMLLAKNRQMPSNDGYPDSARPKVDSVRSTLNMENGIAGFTKLEDKEIELIEVESLLLQEAVAVVHKAAPMMNEIALLEDAASRLKEPFLMVIVGEFNSGKSTVINALLGRRYLNEGVIPTTNEVTLLCYSNTDSNKPERCERNPDGQVICYLSAPILQNMNLVDTPGTNVILQRQQLLTEEFVPRADLVLFVISSDRPLTESEVAFLQYVQQWKKKVVFVLNKVDIYQNACELEEATSFILENTKKLLSTGDVKLYPISARYALDAKLSALNYSIEKQEEVLFNDPRWMSSKFHELEQFLFSFLDGSTDTGMERVKLKLETPIAIAELLLDSSERLVKQQEDNVYRDLISIKEVGNAIEVYAMKMENEIITWKKKAVSLIEKAKAQAIKLIEITLQISNVDLIAAYAFKREKFSSVPSTSTLQNKIIDPALSDMQRLLEEYSEWLQSNIASQAELCSDRLQEQCDKSSNLEDSRQFKTTGYLEKGEVFSLKVMENFSPSAASRLFEQEIREVILGTFGGLGAAGLSASLLTSILPTTLEDLLALGFCSAGGFLAISNFPARRKEAIEKVRKVADGLSRELEEAMQKDLLQATEGLNSFIKVISQPYQEAAQRRLECLQETQKELSRTAQNLQDLKVQIQNLHL